MTTSKLLNVEDITAKTTIVHVGAGRCNELYDYLGTESERIVLVEGDPETVTELQQRVAVHDNVEVTSNIIAADSGKRIFYQYNYPAVNSLHNGVGLKTLFQGVKLISQREVETVGFVDFVLSLNLDLDYRHLLVLDVLGEELHLFDSLKKAGLSNLFWQVVVRMPVSGLYEGGDSESEIFSIGSDAGYDCVRKDVETDPDFPLYLFRLNPERIENERLARELGEAQTRLSELTQKISQFDAELGNSKIREEELYTTLAELRSQLEDINKELGVKVAKNEELQLEVESLRAKCGSIGENRDTVYSQFQESIQKVDEVLRANSELERTLEISKNIEIEQSKTIEALQKKLVDHETDCADTDARNNQIDQEMVRVEAQMDLIKDILIREKVF